MFGLQLNLVPIALAGVVLAGAIGFGYGHRVGDETGAARIQARIDAQERAQSKAIIDALVGRQDAENALTRQSQENANAITESALARAAADERTGRELQRMRDALATAALGARHLASTPAAGPAPDDATAQVAGGLLERCAERRVGVGREAGVLAEQVIGLQDYARMALKACGAPPAAAAPGAASEAPRGRL